MTKEQALKRIDDFVRQLEAIEKIANRFITSYENAGDKVAVRENKLRLELAQGEKIDLLHIKEALLNE